MSNEKHKPVVLQRADPYLYKHTDGDHILPVRFRPMTASNFAAARPSPVWLKRKPPMFGSATKAVL